VTAPVQYGPAVAAYLWHGQFLSRSRAGQAMADLFGCSPSPGAIASMIRRIAGAVALSVAAAGDALAGAPVAHFDETGFRVAGGLAWVHSASSGKYVLVTVHPRRGKAGMDAAGVLPGFAGIACHDAWAPYDCYDCEGHALCCANWPRSPRPALGTMSPGPGRPGTPCSP
jgi:transposase